MRNFTGNGYGNAPRNSRELLMARLSKSFPDRSFDDENLFFDSLLEYEEDMRKRYDYLCQDQMKLADIFMANPRMAEFIGDVLGGDDALAATNASSKIWNGKTKNLPVVSEPENNYGGKWKKTGNTVPVP